MKHLVLQPGSQVLDDISQRLSPGGVVLSGLLEHLHNLQDGVGLHHHLTQGIGAQAVA